MVLFLLQIPQEAIASVSTYCSLEVLQVSSFTRRGSIMTCSVVVYLAHYMCSILRVATRTIDVIDWDMMSRVSCMAPSIVARANLNRRGAVEIRRFDIGIRSLEIVHDDRKIVQYGGQWCLLFSRFPYLISGTSMAPFP